MLRLNRKAPLVRVGQSFFSLQRPVQEVAAVELDCRLCCVHLDGSARFRIRDTYRERGQIGGVV